MGWVVLLKLATHWFHGRNFAMLSGLGLFFGNVGALVGPGSSAASNRPLRMEAGRWCWLPPGIILGIGLLAFFFVKNDPSDDGLLSYAPPTLQRAGTTRNSWICCRGFQEFSPTATRGWFSSHRERWSARCFAFTGLWGRSISTEGPLRPAFDHRSLRLLRDDRLLGGGEPDLRSPFRQNREAETDSFGGMPHLLPSAGRYFFTLPRCRWKAIRRRRGIDQFFLWCGRCGFRLHQGIRTGAIFGNDFGSEANIGNMVRSLCCCSFWHWMDSRQRMARRNDERSARIWRSGISNGISADNRLVGARLCAAKPYAGNVLASKARDCSESNFSEEAVN